MTEFLSVTFAYPTVVFTGLLALSSLYWLLVIVGALGIDVLDLDFDGGHGATEGVAEGAVHGATEGAVKGAAHAVEAGIVGSALVALNLRNVPLTLVLSVWLLVAWLGSYFGAQFVLPALGLEGSFLVGTSLALVALVAALPVTSIIVRPFGRALKVERQTTRSDLVGKMVVVETSRVDARFGSARADDGGAGLIVQIRCDSDNTLQRGSAALVLSYDEGREAFEVTPVDDILPERIPEAKATTKGASEDVQ